MKKAKKDQSLLSTKLENLLSTDKSLYLADLEELFKEKTFAVAILLLMFVPALPIPTGGISHVFLITAALLCLELIAGRKTLWLPEKMKKVGFSKSLKAKSKPFIVKRLISLENLSRPRAAHMYKKDWYSRALGVPLLILIILALFTPPFSGLDTLFAMGAIVVALSIILEDVAFLVVGTLIGILGAIVEIFFGSLIVHFFKNLFH